MTAKISGGDAGSLGADQLSATELLALYEIEPDDLRRVAVFGEQVLAKTDLYVERFYEWLGQQPAFDRFFADPSTLARVKSQQGNSWRELLSGRFDEDLLEHRRQIGQAHARIGLPLHVYLASMNKSFLVWLHDVCADAPDAATVSSLTRLFCLDTAIVIETYLARTNETIAGLLEMSTPVAALWEDVLMLPIVGIIDSRRAQNMMNDVLSKIAETQAKVFVLDISGVAVVDTAVANHLIKITKATKLMGCESIVSGLSAAIAQTIVELGIDVGSVRTTATLRDAVQMAFSLADTEIKKRRVAE